MQSNKEIYLVIAVRVDGKVICKAFERTKYQDALHYYHSFNRERHSVDLKLERVA